VKPYLLLRAAELTAQRPSGEVDDVHFTEALAESVIADATVEGDLVLDPFAGYGTTLAVAERMGRGWSGVELLAEHVEHVRARTSGRRRCCTGTRDGWPSWSRAPSTSCSPHRRTCRPCVIRRTR
jgi:hypothetical protein